ncbi:TetR/AcrR family transcriptional regulator [Mycobacterium sp. D16Q16]|uniref:TetR/AcrR family transcriptional regulator n=1 Tax=Mycobacterium sp. D16Q16 TaxID=1855659 RepID=UPI0009926B18|nr:TetR/AcrR family transcriptional regulator [Mycobacterium sp. D16Q16]
MSVKRPAEIRRRLKGTERRTLIVEAALRLLSERRYDGVSMGDIAKAAGVSRPVLYDHFPSKKELVLSLFHDETEALLKQVRSAARQGMTPRERTWRAVDAYFTFVSEHPVVSQILTLDSAFEPDIAESGRQMRTLAEMGIAPLLEAEFERRGKEPAKRLAEINAAVLVAGIIRIYEWWLEHPGVTRAEIVEYTLGTLWPGSNPTMG